MAISLSTYLIMYHTITLLESRKTTFVVYNYY